METPRAEAKRPLSRHQVAAALAGASSAHRPERSQCHSEGDWSLSGIGAGPGGEVVSPRWVVTEPATSVCEI